MCGIRGALLPPARTKTPSPTGGEDGLRCESVCSSPADGQIKSVHVFHVKQYERQAEPCGNKIAKKCPAGFNHACRSVQGINKNTLIAQNIRVGTETYGAQLRRWAGTALLALPHKNPFLRRFSCRTSGNIVRIFFAKMSSAGVFAEPMSAGCGCFRAAPWDSV